MIRLPRLRFSLRTLVTAVLVMGAVLGANLLPKETKRKYPMTLEPDRVMQWGWPFTVYTYESVSWDEKPWLERDEVDGLGIVLNVSVLAGLLIVTGVGAEIAIGKKRPRLLKRSQAGNDC
jgi:hypothetical protein